MGKKKSMGRPPAFQFYAKDWISSKAVRMMNPVQRGYYIQLLAEAWDSTPIGTLPNDTETLRTLALEPDRDTWERLSPAVLAEFKMRAKRLSHPRLIIERDKQIERKTKCKLAGHISASKRKDKRLHANKRSTDVGTNAQQKSNSSSSSSTSSSIKTINTKPSPAAIELVPAVLEVTSPEETQTLPLDSRHIRLKTMVQNAWSSHNGGLQCPWDGSEGKQAQAILKATPQWHDSQFAQCLANMYATTGFPAGTRPREFLPRLPKYLNGPLNEYNREQGNGQVSKADKRSNEISRTTRGIFDPSRVLHGNHAAGVQEPVIGSRADPLARNALPQRGTVLDAGDRSGSGGPDRKPAPTGD